MNWKDFIKILVGAFIPTLWSLIAGTNPPFDEAMFGAIIMWLLNQ